LPSLPLCGSDGRKILTLQQRIMRIFIAYYSAIKRKN
jgi:hypothetical protein